MHTCVCSCPGARSNIQCVLTEMCLASGNQRETRASDRIVGGPLVGLGAYSNSYRCRRRRRPTTSTRQLASGTKLKRNATQPNALTTSMICWRVRPNFTDSASDSLATGRSRMLYELSRWLSRRFSCGPWVLSADKRSRSVRWCSWHSRCQAMCLMFRRTKPIGQHN